MSSPLFYQKLAKDGDVLELVSEKMPLRQDGDFFITLLGKQELAVGIVVVRDVGVEHADVEHVAGIGFDGLQGGLGIPMSAGFFQEGNADFGPQIVRVEIEQVYQSDSLSLRRADDKAELAALINVLRLHGYVLFKRVAWVGRCG